MVSISVSSLLGGGVCGSRTHVLSGARARLTAQTIPVHPVSMRIAETALSLVRAGGSVAHTMKGVLLHGLLL